MGIVSIMGSGYKPVLICDVCSYWWPQLKPASEYKECQNRDCRSRRWNDGKDRRCSCGKLLSGNQRMHCSGKCKDRAKKLRPKDPPWITQVGQHHDLCPCLSCLAEIVQPKAKPDRRKYPREHPRWSTWRERVSKGNGE